MNVNEVKKKKKEKKMESRNNRAKTVGVTIHGNGTCYSGNETFSNLIYAKLDSEGHAHALQIRYMKINVCHVMGSSNVSCIM